MNAIQACALPAVHIRAVVYVGLAQGALKAQCISHALASGRLKPIHASRTLHAQRNTSHETLVFAGLADFATVTRSTLTSKSADAVDTFATGLARIKRAFININLAVLTHETFSV
jgi:hypothetical protein